MKRVIEHVRNHGQKIHSHVKKHHKKYLFGLVSAALLFKLIPLLVASVFTTKLHFSFADDLLNNGSEISVFENENSENNSGNILLIEQLSPVPGTYTGPSIDFTWSGNATAEDYSGYQIKVYTGDDCSNNELTLTGVGVGINETGVTLTGFSSGNYCWSISLSGSNERIYTGFTVIDPITEPEIIPLSIELLSPVPGIYEGPSIGFTWSGNAEVLDYTGYQIKIYTGEDCSNNNDTITGKTVSVDTTSATIEGFLPGNYCWSISALGDTGRVYTGFTVVDPLEIKQLSPVPGTYTGPSIEFAWIGNNTALEYYTGYGIKVYTGADCTNNNYTITGRTVSSDSTGATLTGFSSGSYCWSISALGDNRRFYTGFTVVDPLPASMNGQCDVDDIKVLSPKTGSYIKGAVEMLWQFIGDDCDGRDIIVAVHTGVSGGYIDIRSGVIPNYTGYTYDTTGISEGRLAIYVSSGDDKFSLMANNEYQIDNVKPTVTGVNYRFDPRTTGGLFGLNHTIYISFTGSEVLTGITVNVMGRNANLYDKSGVRYEYALSGFTNNNSNPGNLMFNISYQDVAGNTGYYEKSDTGYTADYIKPNLSGGIKLDLKSGDTITASIDLTKTGKIELNYVQSGTNKGGTKTGSYSLSHRFTINELKKNKIYKYTVLVEDKAGNKSYFGSWFSISGNNIVSGSIRDLNSNDMITEVGFTNTGSILSSLKSQLNEYNNCKSSIRYRTGMSVPIQYKDSHNNTFTYYTLSVKRPVFSSGTLDKKVYTLVSAIAENLGKMSQLTTTGYKTINEDLNNYIIAVKLARDSSDSCSKHHLSNYYGSKFIKTLRKYGLIK